MRRYTQLYLLYVAGFIPLVAVVGVFEDAVYGRWGLSATDWGYQLGTFARTDARWLVYSGVVAAAIIRVLLNRLAARQPAHHELLAAGAGLVAIVAAVGVVDTAAVLVNSDAWQDARMLLTLPVAFVGCALLYGFVAVIWMYGDSFPPGVIVRWWDRQERLHSWLYHPIIPETGVRPFPGELSAAVRGWNPDDVPAVRTARDFSEAGLDVMEALLIVTNEILRLQKTYMGWGPIDEAAARNVLAWLDRCEELLAEEELPAALAAEQFRIARFVRKSRTIAEVFVKMSDGEYRTSS